MTSPREQQQRWLGQVEESAVNPQQAIVDPHHHLWRGDRGALPEYVLDDLWADTQASHNIVKTVFMECGSEYRADGPEHLRCVGETEFVAELAQASRGSGKAEIAGIVGHVSMAQDEGLIREALDLHVDRGDGLFRGIRHGGAHDSTGTVRWLNSTPDPNLYAGDAFRRGVKILGSRDLSYDTWHYHPQNPGFRDLAAACPDTQLILDHFGTPVRVGAWENDQAGVWQQFRKDMKAIAECPNVVVKIGGLAMPPNGFGWTGRELPPSSDEVVEAQRDWYRYTIDCFGPERCMFESNFPVDKMSLSYTVYWNAMQKIAAEYSDAEQDAMFSGTATRIYKLA